MAAINVMLFVLALINCCLTSSSGQIHFPRDDSDPVINITALEKQRGTKTYDDTVDSIISRGVLKLTMSLQKYMSYQSKAENVVFAPVNIGGALALVLLGSSGKTFNEISNILGLASGVDILHKSERVHQQIGRLMNKLDRTSSFDVGEEIKLATAVFVQDDFPIRSVFKQTSEQIYRSEVLNLDFQSNSEKAKNVINAWVSDRTGGKIKTMLDNNPPESTKVIIASALYFKAAWEKPFFEASTKRRPFYTNGRDNQHEGVKMVDMMTNGGLFPYYRDRTLDCEIMGFPYKENQSTLYVILPNRSNKEKLVELQNRLSPDDLERLVDNTRYTQSVIGFPKMILESTLDLAGALSQFGAKSLFNPREANLALISPGRQDGGAGGGSDPNDQFVANAIRNPISANLNNDHDDNDDVLIFTRSGFPVNCTEIFDPTSNITKCQQIDEATQKEVVYKKFGDKVGRRITRNAQNENIDNVRMLLKDDDNPGLYADQVLHKVFMEITESGTEAAAATSVSLTRGGDITSFRVDQPFMFFIRNHETRLVLFWGSVNLPTPNFN